MISSKSKVGQPGRVERTRFRGRQTWVPRELLCCPAQCLREITAPLSVLVFSSIKSGRGSDQGGGSEEGSCQILEVEPPED